MKRIALCGGVLAAALLCGCASQSLHTVECYEPTPETIHERGDGLKVGALKSETTKSGQPDWSGNKSFFLFSW